MPTDLPIWDPFHIDNAGYDENISSEPYILTVIRQHSSENVFLILALVSYMIYQQRQAPVQMEAWRCFICDETIRQLPYLYECTFTGGDIEQFD